MKDYLLGTLMVLTALTLAALMMAFQVALIALIPFLCFTTANFFLAAPFHFTFWQYVIMGLTLEVVLSVVGALIKVIRNDDHT